ncbi:MAG: hypothetical protein ACPHRO_04075, partial [Nannocystaceae bacterium]
MVFTPRALAIFTLSVLCACTSAPHRSPKAPELHAPLRYEIEIDGALTTMTQTICWDAPGPRTLRTSDPAGMQVVETISSASGHVVRRVGSILDVSGLNDADCVSLNIDLDAVAEQRRLRPTHDELAPSLWLPTDAWLWFDNDDDVRADATINWSAPPEVELATPWELTAPRTYLVRRDDFDWKTVIALGSLEHRSFETSGATVSVTALDPSHLPSDQVLQPWLSQSLETVASLHDGVFPRRRVNVFLIPTRRPSSEPVVFGLVTRGGIAPTVSLFLSNDASEDALRGEWVAIHELLHVAMPYVASVDAWLSEGFVTYLTEVLRARHGYYNSDRDFSPGTSLDFRGIDAAQAQTLMALTTLQLGLERGQKESSRFNLSLREASEKLGNIHAF